MRRHGTIVIESAALYQALHRLERKKLVRAWWGQSEVFSVVRKMLIDRLPYRDAGQLVRV